MLTLTVTTDDQSGIAGALSGLRGQLPFALSVAINNTLNDAQSAIQAKLPDEFTLRRADFIQKTIYIAPGDRARKDNLVGTVRVNPDRNFLAKFEYGGEKQSASGKSLAIPIMRASDPSLIIGRGDPLSVKMLMASITASHGKVLRSRVRKGQLRVAVDPNRVFLLKTDKGTFIVQRTGPGAGDTRILWQFRKQTALPANLDFENTAMQAALKSWDGNVTKAIAYAIATMR